MTPPVHTGTLAQLRQDIDDLDERIVALLAERARVVRKVAAHKRDAEEVRAPGRARRVVRHAGEIAERHGLPAGVAEAVYRVLIDELTSLELSELGSPS